MTDVSSDVAPLAPPGPGAVFVHLFEWKWTDIARECESYLGPAGFAAVQVSPPSEHAIIPGTPWWQRYQTVGYSVARSRSGTGDEFKDMVRRCAASGVAIYVDAVINHMTGQSSGVGSNGTAYTKYSYPNLYTAADFHMPACTIAGADYQNAANRVRDCELVGLADLNMSSENVRGKIAEYLSSLVMMGVRGFRIDAAKHMHPSDLDAILRLMDRLVDASAKPYFFHEVIDYGGEAISASEYLATAAGAIEPVGITEFRYTGVANAFLNGGGKTLLDLRNLGETTWGLLPSDRAVVFINNHDTQRALSTLIYQDGPSYDLATVFMLAWPYGYPSILSSFAFNRVSPVGRDSGPPAAAPDCATLPQQPATLIQGWLCEHRRPYIAPMLAFRKATASAPAVTNRWDDGANQLAFGRGDKGFVVINRSATSLTRAFTTSLPAGAYCDVYQGSAITAGCSGTRVDVGAGGTADITVAPFSAVVLHIGAQPK